MKTFKVATFADRTEKGKLRVEAYTMWYSPKWSGYVGFEIVAKNGTEAKKIAIQLRKEHERKNSNNLE